MKIIIGMAANIVFTKDKGIDFHMINVFMGLSEDE